MHSIGLSEGQGPLATLTSWAHILCWHQSHATVHCQSGRVTSCYINIKLWYYMCLRQNMDEWQDRWDRERKAVLQGYQCLNPKLLRNMWSAFSCWATGTPQQSYLSKHCKLINHWKTQRDCICREMLSRLRGDQSVSIAIFSRGHPLHPPDR